MSRLLSNSWLPFVFRWAAVLLLLAGAFGLGSLLRIPSGSVVEMAQACDWVTRCGVSGCSNNASGFAAACAKEEAEKAKSASANNSSSNKTSGSSSSSSNQKCDGWADPGTTHRNSGNGCNYTCKNGGWSGPNQCDGSGNGQFQGEAAVSADERARQEEAVRERQKEAEDKVAAQGAAETAQIAAQTAEQRAKEAARQQAMVESQRQTAVAEAQAKSDQAALDEANRKAQAASQQVSQAQGTNRGSEIVGTGDLRARDIAAVGYDPNSALALGTANLSQMPQSSQVALANAAVNVANLNSACDVNTGSPNSVGAGAACCRGGVVECGGGTNGSCMSEIDRPGVVGYCGATGQPDVSGFCGDNFCQATETAQNCAKDCAVTSSIGYRLYSFEGGECIPCVPGATRGCVSLAACQPQLPLSATAVTRAGSLNMLYRQCYFDIDMAEGTLDPSCLSNLSRSVQQLQEQGGEGVKIVNTVQRQIAAERQVYGLAGTIASQQVNCGSACATATAENQQKLEQAYQHLNRVNPDRVEPARQKSQQYEASINAAFQERERLVTRYRTEIEAMARACNSSDPSCAQGVQEQVEQRLGSYSSDSDFCEKNPLVSSCKKSVGDVQREINEILIAEVYTQARYTFVDGQCRACRADQSCQYASLNACQQANIPAEDREEVSSCSQGTYETSEACDPLGGCSQAADGCWQRNAVTAVSPPAATVPVTCSNGTPLNTRSTNGLYCNDRGELVREAPVTATPQQPAAVPGSGLQIPGYREFLTPDGQALDARSCTMRGYIFSVDSCYAPILAAAPAQPVPPEPVTPVLTPEESDRIVTDTLRTVVELNRDILDLETRRLTSIANGQTQFAAVIQEEIDALKNQRQTLSTQSVQNTDLSIVQRTDLAGQLREAVSRSNDQVRNQQLITMSGIASENQYMNQQLNTYQGLVQQLQNTTDNPTAYTQVRAQVSSLERSIQQICPPTNTTPTCNQMRNTVSSNQSVVQKTQEDTAIAGMANLRRSVEQQAAIFRDPVLSEATQVYSDQASCERSGWSQCVEIPSESVSGYHPTETATYSDPNLFRSATNNLLGVVEGRGRDNIVFNGQHTFTRVETGRCHSANHIAGTNMLVNGSCYQTTGDTAITYSNPNDSSSCVSNDQYTRNLVNGLCLSTLIPPEVVPPVDEPEVTAQVADPDLGNQIVEGAVQAVKDLNQEIYDLEILRLTAVVEGRFRSAATIQEEIDALKSQRQILAVENAKNPLLAGTVRQNLATQLTDSIAASNAQITEQRSFFQEGAAVEAGTVNRQQSTYEDLLQTLVSSTDIAHYVRTRNEIQALERNVPALCPESNVTLQCDQLRATVEAGQEWQEYALQQTAVSGPVTVQRLFEQQIEQFRNPLAHERYVVYADDSRCQEAGWSQCQRREIDDYVYYTPESTAEFRDPNPIRALTHSVVRGLTGQGDPELTVNTGQVLSRVEDAKCHVGYAAMAAVINGACYQADENSYFGALGDDPQSCQTDDTYYRTKVNGFCLTTPILPEIGATEEPSEESMDQAALEEAARFQRNALALSQFIRSGLGPVTPIVNIAWSSWNALGEMGRAQPVDLGHESEVVYLECGDQSQWNELSHDGSSRTVRQVCDHLNRDRGYSICTPERVDGTGEVILCNKDAFENLSEERQELLIDHELVHSQFQDREGRALHDYCSSKGVSIDDETYHSTSYTQQSCIGVAELGAQIISYDAFGEDYAFLLADPGGVARNSQATTQQALDHLSSNCPGASTETIVSAMLGDSDSYGQLVGSCSAPPHELIPDRYRRGYNVADSLNPEILQLAVSEYEVLSTPAESSPLSTVQNLIDAVSPDVSSDL